MPQRIMRADDSRTAAQKAIADWFRFPFDYVIGRSGCHLGTYGKMADSICGHAFSEASFNLLPLVKCCSDWYLDMERSHDDTSVECHGLDPQNNRDNTHFWESCQTCKSCMERTLCDCTTRLVRVYVIFKSLRTARRSSVILSRFRWIGEASRSMRPVFKAISYEWCFQNIEGQCQWDTHSKVWRLQRWSNWLQVKRQGRHRT